MTGKTKLSEADALIILIAAAGAHLRGSGLGLPPEKTDKEKDDIALAVERMWRKAYRYDLDAGSCMNLGIDWYRTNAGRAALQEKDG